MRAAICCARAAWLCTCCRSTSISRNDAGVVLIFGESDQRIGRGDLRVGGGDTRLIGKSLEIQAADDQHDGLSRGPVVGLRGRLQR